MVCSSCSAENPDGSRYCASCGLRLDEAQASPSLVAAQASSEAGSAPAAGPPASPPLVVAAKKSPAKKLGGAAAIGAVVVAVLAFQSDAMQPTLSEIGLNTKACATNLFGVTVCGEDLVAFCEERYDPDVNEDVCRQVLVDADLDPDAIAQQNADAEQAEIEDTIAESEQREQERLDAEREANRVKGDSSAFTADDGLEIRPVTSETATAIESEYDVVRPDGGSRFVVFAVAVRNVGDKPTSAQCSWSTGSGATLLDADGKSYSLDSDAMISHPENDTACGDDLQPGGESSTAFVFEVPDSVKPEEIQIWDPEQPGPDEGGTHLVYALGNS